MVVTIYDLWISGGRDSVVAATVAADIAKQEGIRYRVVFINELKAFNVPENLLPYNPLDYVRKFARWLNAELVVLEPEFDFWEGVKRWGYPMLFKNRWCFRKLKKEVLEKFALQERRQGLDPVWVMGIRRSESFRRTRLFTKERFVYRYGSVYVKIWLPILDWSEEGVKRFIEERGIPENPLWRLGFSFECLCMAGMTRKKLDEAIATFPRLYKWLAEKDKEIQQYRRRADPIYPAPLLDKKIPLYEYVEKQLASTLEKYLKH